MSWAPVTGLGLDLVLALPLCCTVVHVPVAEGPEPGLVMAASVYDFPFGLAGCWGDQAAP